MEQKIKFHEMENIYKHTCVKWKKKKNLSDFKCKFKFVIIQKTLDDVNIVNFFFILFPKRNRDSCIWLLFRRNFT